MKSVRISLAVAFIFSSMLGCSRHTAQTLVPDALKNYPPAYGDVLVEGTIGEPTILNPILASDSASHEVTDLIFSSLLKYDKDLNLIACLAAAWEVSPDGKVITFHLRKDAKWQDGKQVTAADVKFTLERYMDPTVKTAYRSNYENVLRSEALDNNTFRVYYKEAFAPALETIGGMPVLPEHLLKGKDINTTDDFNFHPVGCGPYRYGSWNRGESVTLQANAEYFEGRPYLNRVVLRIIPDMAVQFLELRNGGLDMMSLTPNQFTGEGNKPEFKAAYNKYRYPSNQFTYMGFNLKNPMFQDKRFREAIALSINKQALVDGVLEGLGKVSTGPYTPSTWAFNPDVKPVAFDQLKARELFVASGYRYASDGTLTKNNVPVEFTILTNQGNRDREQTLTIIQAQLKEVGIKVTPRIIAWSTFLSEFVNKRKFDAVILGWSLAQDPDLYDIWHSSKTGENEFNFVSYKNPEVDRLLEAGRRTFNRDKRTQIYHDVHRLIAQDLPYVFLYVPDSLPAVHRRVLGIDPGPAGIGYNFNKWFVPEGFQKYTQ
jgi:peptide/nickel transport system substrate-binding protein